MKKVLFIIVCQLFLHVISAQISPIVPSSTSIANTSAADSKTWNAFSNPANFGYTSDIEFGFQYENRYILPELSTRSLNFVLPTSYINSAFSASYFGYSFYNEILLGVGFARNFGDQFSMGVQLNYLSAYFASTNEYHGSFFPQIGLNVRLSSCFHIGFSTFNPFQSNIQTDYVLKRLPSIFSLGCEYFLSPELVLRSQMDKEISSNYRFAVGAEYSMLDFLTVKIGAYDSDYLVPCLGFNTELGSFCFGLNGELHPLLGLVSCASVKYRIEK